jgi:hypothetical protein
MSDCMCFCSLGFIYFSDLAQDFLTCNNLLVIPTWLFHRSLKPYVFKPTPLSTILLLPTYLGRDFLLIIKPNSTATDKHKKTFLKFCVYVYYLKINFGSSSKQWPTRMVCCSLDLENPTKSHKSRGSNLCVHFKNTWENTQAIKGTHIWKATNIWKMSL